MGKNNDFGYGQIFNSRIELFDRVCDNLIEGDIAEFGVYMGESLDYISSITNCERKYYGFDSFKGLPKSKYPSVFREGAFRVNSPPVFECKKIKLIIGWFKDTLINEKIYFDKLALLHIDVDIYESTVAVLEYCHNYIQKGTIIQFDEIWASWKNNEQHEYKAWKEYIEKYGVKYNVVGSTEEAGTKLRGAFQIIDFKKE